jgi:hypothetical protein
MKLPTHRSLLRAGVSADAAEPELPDGYEESLEEALHADMWKNVRMSVRDSIWQLKCLGSMMLLWEESPGDRRLGGHIGHIYQP